MSGRFRRGRFGMIIMFAAAALVREGAVAHAQALPHDSTMARDSARQRAVLIAPTVVTATRELQPRTESSVTIDAVSREEIARTRASHPSGIMNRVAGVHVTELSAEGHSTAIRQPLTTKPMYLYL